MKKLQLFLILAITFIACKQEGINPPQKGSVQFSLSKKLANSGGRVSSTVTPKVVLLSIEDAVGNSIELNKNLILYTFGAGFVSESLTLAAGTYKLAQFLVLDSAGHTIYASPLSGSPMAEFVDTPLPMEFTVTENGNILVTPQVLTVEPSSTPTSFGYANFGFEIVKSQVNLNLHLQYPASMSFDSAYITFTNSNSQLKLKLTLDNATHIATGLLTNIHIGDWKISTSYFSTITTNFESLENNGALNLRIMPTATDLISLGQTAYLVDGTSPAEQSIPWSNYYYYYVYSSNHY